MLNIREFYNFRQLLRKLFISGITPLNSSYPAD